MVKNRFLGSPLHTHTLQKRLARCLSPDSNAIQSLVFRSSSETGFWPVPCEQKTQVSFSSLGNESCPTLCIWFLTAGDVVPAVYKWGEPKRRLLRAAMGFWREQDTGAATAAAKVQGGQREPWDWPGYVCSLTPRLQTTQGNCRGESRAAVNSDADRQPDGNGGSQAGKLPAVAWPCLWQ